MSRPFAPETSLGAAPSKGPQVAQVAYDEDLLGMAAQAYALADQFCGTCKNYHALWPYHRLALGSGQGGLTAIEHAIAGQIQAGARRVLVAGAADTGLLATVARAAAGCDIEMAVVDRCPTPVELCRRFAERWSLPVTTTVADIAYLDGGDFDLVYASSILPFVPAERRASTIAGMHRALKPGGHLLYVFTTSARMADERFSEFRAEHVSSVLAGLDHKSVPRPDLDHVLQARLGEYARELKSRDGIFDRPEAIEALVRSASFVIKDRTELSGSRQYFAPLSKRRHLLLGQAPLP
jgi:SAM-dependent methyltransferase